MGKLDEPQFEALVNAGCPACGHRTFRIRCFLDRALDVMLGDPNNEGRWVYDGEKFVDGIYHISCTSCQRALFDDAGCPRCHADGGLARALAEPSRLQVPKTCPACRETELLAVAMIPGLTSYTGGKPPPPTTLCDFGDPGYHIVAFACANCDAATVAPGCPLCDAPGPLRPRP
jgi:hypothetical protein